MGYYFFLRHKIRRSGVKNLRINTQHIMKTLLFIPVAALAILLMPSCRDDAETGDNFDNAASSTKAFRVKMTDGPGNFKAVNMQITKVEAFVEDPDEGQPRWLTLNAASQSVNIIDLNNGEEMVLAEDNSPEKGRYSKLRVTFGTDNQLQLISGGSSDWLNIGFSSESAHEVVVDIEDEQVDGSVEHEILLDFNVALSVHQNGLTYWIDPVITEINDEMTGARGRIEGSLYASVLFKSSGAAYHTYTSPAGDFLVRGMLDGTYDLTIEGQDEDDHQMNEMTIHNVIIVQGEIRNMGIIQFD